MFCNSHQNDIHDFHDALVTACLEAGSDTLPVRTQNNRKSVPGWQSVVDEQKSRANFWHTLWKENGSPREGILAEIRRVTRARYYYAIRCVRKDKELHTSNRLADLLCSNHNQDFWSSVKPLEGKNNGCVKSVDQAVGDEAIGDVLSMNSCTTACHTTRPIWKP